MLKHCTGLGYRTVGLLTVLIALFISNIVWADDLFTFHAQTGDSIALSGLKVYAFTESGSYTGKNNTTDENGDAVFDISDLADGIYKFRLDYLGQQIWSDVVSIPDETSVTITVQQRNVPVTVESNTGVLAGYRVYLFTSSGSYLGLNQITDINGQVFFDLPIGAEYKFRADYLGYQFWSDVTTIQSDTVVDLFIPQQDVTITVRSLFDTLLPMQGVRVYLFTASGSYMSQYQNTDQNGQVVFTLPEKGYKVRADYLGRQYWSDEIIWQDTEITVPMADAEITVSGGGQPLSNVNVYVFNENNSYLSISGTTDNDGMITFRLPEGSYKFRADYQGSQYWSSVESLIAGEVNLISISTGGGSFALSVLKGDSEPLPDVNCYVFSESGSYLGMNGITNNDGLVTFDLSDGNYKFRIDCLGYQFWSDVYDIPATLAQDVLINHQDVTITVNTGFQGITTPLEGIKVYLFTAAGTYMNQNFTTDTDGQVVFSLPNQSYKVRVDYLNQQFWSDEIIQQDTGITISMADAEIHVSGNGQPIANIPVYVFTGSGTYLNLNQLTDQDGSTVFRLPASGTYKLRADYQGSQYWTNEVSLLPDQVNVIELSTGGGTFSFTVLKGTDDPLVGVNCYVFSESGSYLGLTAATNSEGLVTFNLADGHYKFRVDYLGYQYWSNVYEVPVTLMDTLLIAHEETTITVTSEYQQTSEPLSGVPVYLFTQGGSYMNQNQTTDANGQVVFNLPENAYKVRADYMRQQFWSDEISGPETPVTITLGEVEITITESFVPVESVHVYAFTATGTYLNIYQLSDVNGIVTFRLPVGTYSFRMDYEGNQYWLENIEIEPDMSLPINYDFIELVWEGDYAIETQADLEALSGYTRINGDLIIIQTPLVDLEPLSALNTVTGDLLIYGNEYLENLDGLRSLTHVGEDFYIGYQWGYDVSMPNPLLANINGLNSLISVGRTFRINYNESLVSLDGLENLNTIGVSLIIARNESLTNITALSNLTEIGQHLDIELNPVLTSLSGLENISHINGGVWVANNDSLTSLMGLHNISHVERGVDICGNNAIVSLDGLQGIVTIGDSFSIRYNDNLENVNGVEALTSIGTRLYIFDNDLLTNLDGFNSLVYLGTLLFVADNAVLPHAEILEVHDQLIDFTGSIITYDNLDD